MNIVEENLQNVEEEKKHYNTRVSKFEQELEHLINRHSIESASNTPDFILAMFLRMCLQTFNIIIERREEWYGGKTCYQADEDTYRTDENNQDGVGLTLDDVTPEKFSDFLLKSEEEWNKDKNRREQ